MPSGKGQGDFVARKRVEEAIASLRQKVESLEVSMGSNHEWVKGYREALADLRKELSR